MPTHFQDLAEESVWNIFSYIYGNELRARPHDDKDDDDDGSEHGSLLGSAGKPAIDVFIPGAGDVCVSKMCIELLVGYIKHTPLRLTCSCDGNPPPFFIRMRVAKDDSALDTEDVRFKLSWITVDTIEARNMEVCLYWLKRCDLHTVHALSVDFQQYHHGSESVELNFWKEFVELLTRGGEGPRIDVERLTKIEIKLKVKHFESYIVPLVEVVTIEDLDLTLYSDEETGANSEQAALKKIGVMIENKMPEIKTFRLETEFEGEINIKSNSLQKIDTENCPSLKTTRLNCPSLKECRVNVGIGDIWDIWDIVDDIGELRLVEVLHLHVVDPYDSGIQNLQAAINQMNNLKRLHLKVQFRCEITIKSNLLEEIDTAESHECFKLNHSGCPRLERLNQVYCEKYVNLLKSDVENDKDEQKEPAMDLTVKPEDCSDITNSEEEEDKDDGTAAAGKILKEAQSKRRKHEYYLMPWIRKGLRVKDQRCFEECRAKARSFKLSTRSNYNALDMGKVQNRDGKCLSTGRNYNALDTTRKRKRKLQNRNGKCLSTRTNCNALDTTRRDGKCLYAPIPSLQISFNGMMGFKAGQKLVV